MQGLRVRSLIAEECDYIKELLLKKNADYGNSVFEPLGIFSRLTPDEALKIRIEDKLKRIKNGYDVEGQQHHMEDSTRDLCGYLILLRIWDRIKTEGE